jgi:hypothetical protein
MPGQNFHDLKHRVDALQLNVVGLFKLLGSKDPDERLRLWEILKGITTPAEFALIDHELTAMNSLVTQAEMSAKNVMAAAKMASGPAKAICH